MVKIRRKKLYPAFLFSFSILIKNTFLFFKTKNCSNEYSFINCNDRIGKMVHNICRSAVPISLSWASCDPWASWFSAHLRRRLRMSYCYHFPSVVGSPSYVQTFGPLLFWNPWANFVWTSCGTFSQTDNYNLYKSVRRMFRPLDHFFSETPGPILSELRVEPSLKRIITIYTSHDGRHAHIC